MSPAVYIQNNFSKKKIRTAKRMSNGLDPDQNRHSVGPDLGQNFLQRYQQATIDVTNRERIEITIVITGLEETQIFSVKM